MKPVVHVEMYDSQLFCDATDVHGIDNAVDQRAWHEDASVLSSASCLGCLAAIHALGSAAERRADDLVAAGVTEEEQDAWMRNERRKRDATQLAAGHQTMTLAAFDKILKERY